MSEKPSEEDVTRWVRTMCTLAGIKSVQWNDGTVGLVDVPRKYLAVVDAMHQGLIALAAGKPLPRLVLAEQPKKAKRVKP